MLSFELETILFEILSQVCHWKASNNNTVVSLKDLLEAVCKWFLKTVCFFVRIELGLD